jgi:hypothetical protein
MKIYRAQLKPNGSEWSEWWVSIDGEAWLPVDREPEATIEDYENVRELFGPQHGERDGKPIRFTRMTFARRFVFATPQPGGSWGVGATELEPLEIEEVVAKRD